MKTKEQSGITLIALVITIIVLLILAGVTIAMLSGNNSAPQKATEAAQKDAIACAKDEIAMETQEALLNYYNNKYVSKTSTGAAGEAEAQNIVATAADTAVTNVKNKNKELLSTSGVSGNTITLNTKSFTVTGTIEQNGGITWSDSNASGGVTPADPSDPEEPETPGGKIPVDGTNINLSDYNATTIGQHYGKTVITISGVPYGLFYVDYAGTYSGGEEGTVYLRAKSSVTSTRLDKTIQASTDKTAEQNQEAAIEIMKKINPQWNTARGLTPYSSFTWAEKGTAYLCNPNYAGWSGKGSGFGEDLNYVIGGPSLELFLASYNAKYPVIEPSSATPEYSAHFNLSGNLNSSWTYPGYLYGKKESASGTPVYNTSYSSAIQTGDATVGYMYRNTSTALWMASPVSSGIDSSMCWVSSDGYLSDAGANNNWGVEPLISLKPGVDLTVE